VKKGKIKEVWERKKKKEGVLTNPQAKGSVCEGVDVRIQGDL